VFLNHLLNPNIGQCRLLVLNIVWLRGLLAELGFSQSDSTPLHVATTSAIQIAANPVYYERTKHIEVDCHSIREALDNRAISSSCFY
jgi:hypothetical protein